jgi:tetratricopeptide (TPR) repeat protein
MKHTVRITAGSILILIGIGSVAVFGIPGLLGGTALGMGGALCLYPYLADLGSELLIAPFRAMAGRDSLTLRKEYSEVHAALSQHDYEGALAQIEAVLVDTPNAIEAQLLRVQICYENLNRIEDGLKHAFAALESLEWNDTQGKIVMLAVDMLIDAQRPNDAGNLLHQAGQRLINCVQREAALARLSNLLI